MSFCENCQIEHDESYGSGRFCNSKCARAFSTKSKRHEINEKVSKSLVGRVSPKKGTGTINRITETRNCTNCLSEYTAQRSTAQYCSRKCAREYTSAETKMRLSAAMQRVIAEGRHHGWQKRNIRSYPETFFECVLQTNGIPFVAEFPVKQRDLGFNNSYRYFLDFYISEKKIDLEIDGRQHQDPERIIKDKIRDDALTLAGFKVYRIKWKNINSTTSSQYIKNEIDKFIIFYQQCPDV